MVLWREGFFLVLTCMSVDTSSRYVWLLTFAYQDCVLCSSPVAPAPVHVLEVQAKARCTVELTGHMCVCVSHFYSLLLLFLCLSIFAWLIRQVPAAFQMLMDTVEHTMTHAIVKEEKIPLEEVTNFDEVSSRVQNTMTIWRLTILLNCWSMG